MNNTNQQDAASTSPSSSLDLPSLANLVWRIGITGHRPDNLQSGNIELLRSQIRTVLEFIQKTLDRIYLNAPSIYSTDAPVLRLISPLAEGTDRLIVNVVTAFGGRFDLQCPLPFHKERYEEDFATPESRAEFRALLSRASSVLELDGSRTKQGQDQAYEAVGRMVLNHSDVMISVWDGSRNNLRGGTSQIISEAEVLGIPLICIDSQTPHAIKVKLSERDKWLTWESTTTKLAETFETLIMPPGTANTKDQKESVKHREFDLRQAYFLEVKRKWKPTFFWKMLLRLAPVRALKPPASSQPSADMPQETADQIESGPITTASSQPSADMPQESADQLDSALGSHYKVADRMADYYAHVYRSAFVFNYLMSAFAVSFAFSGYVVRRYHQTRFVFNLIEVLIILAIICVTLFGTKRHWHQRWIEYRLLAEHLRQTQFLMALGRAPVSIFQSSARIPNGNSRNSWVYWYLHALVRQAGMINARLDANYLDSVRKHLYKEGFKDQIKYHDGIARRFEVLNHRLHRIGIVLFILAFTAAFLHFFLHQDYFAVPLTILTIVGPAFGASFAAIRSQGEFERLTKRSREISSKLKGVAERLAAIRLQDDDLSSIKLSEIAIDGTQRMVEDVLDWRIVVQDKPLDFPG